MNKFKGDSIDAFCLGYTDAMRKGGLITRSVYYSYTYIRNTGDLFENAMNRYSDKKGYTPGFVAGMTASCAADLSLIGLAALTWF